MTTFHSLRRAKNAERRREFLAAGFAMLRNEPWRFVSLIINLALALILAREIPREHSPGFFIWAALAACASCIGNAWLARYLKARQERKNLQEEYR